MPRKVIELPYQVEYLSILDADGNVDEALEPALPDQMLHKLHRAMVLGQAF